MVILYTNIYMKHNIFIIYFDQLLRESCHSATWWIIPTLNHSSNTNKNKYEFYIFHVYWCTSTCHHSSEQQLCMYISCMKYAYIFPHIAFIDGWLQWDQYRCTPGYSTNNNIFNINAQQTSIINIINIIIIITSIGC